jgi:hypothetical protein
MDNEILRGINNEDEGGVYDEHQILKDRIGEMEG